MRRFLVCIHDATPAYTRETRAMIRDLAPLVGRRLSLGVVPNWRGTYALAAHPAYCAMVRDASQELLLHGYSHRRQRGRGVASWLTGNSDEMNGFDAEGTRRALECGQQVFTDVFGEPARTFLPPAWQRGHVRVAGVNTAGLQHVLGFFSLESAGRRVPVSTWTWDCGRWRSLGHLGHAIGWMLHSLNHGVPVLAIHPRDLERGFWPRILRLTERLVDAGWEPSTPAALLAAGHVEVDI